MSAEWGAADTLEAPMALAMEVAAQLDLLALLPADVSQPGWYCPLSLAPPPGLPLPPQHQPNPPPRDPNAMEIDATTTRPGNHPPTILDISFTLCQSKNLCFWCLKPVSPPNHTVSLNCWNNNTPTNPRKRRSSGKQRQIASYSENSVLILFITDAQILNFNSSELSKKLVKWGVMSMTSLTPM
jgi:hypothetical protein